MRGRVGSEAAPNSERRGPLFCQPQMPFRPSAFAQKASVPEDFSGLLLVARSAFSSFRLRQKASVPEDFSGLLLVARSADVAGLGVCLSVARS